MYFSTLFAFLLILLFKIYVLKKQQHYTLHITLKILFNFHNLQEEVDQMFREVTIDFLWLRFYI